MKEKDFIENLFTERSNYNNPEQAISQAQAIQLLSADVYTDTKRFIYELFQNADDASNSKNTLVLAINFVENYIIISHKGEPFAEGDIKSLSSTGDSRKQNTKNKTGFKGIGFKSVFSHSDKVIIKTGNYCFRYDREYWEMDNLKNTWKSTWINFSQWQAQRKLDGMNENAQIMPWQIIPIWTELPANLQKLPVFIDQSFTVSTIIAYRENIETLKNDLNELLAQTQIILFLRCENVTITVTDNSQQTTILEKKKENGITTLSRNKESEKSEWLTKSVVFPITTDIRTQLNSPEYKDKVPQRLREATETEISFAIALKDTKITAVEKDKRLIFTYLPTKIVGDFPFLVNASFLTDAGREKLHENNVWNNWIFEQIPKHFFEWFAEIAKNESYNEEFLAAFPHRLSGYNFAAAFNKGYNNALATIPFVPNKNGELLLVENSFYDSVEITSLINKQLVIDFVNKAGKNFTLDSYVPYRKYLEKIGVQFFDLDDLVKFLGDSIFVNNHKLEQNFALIEFLYKKHDNLTEDKRKAYNEKMQKVAFIFSKANYLVAPDRLLFEQPTTELNDIEVIHKDIYTKIKSSSYRLKQWLKGLGVQEANDVGLIESIANQSATCVTQKNAIETLRFLFNNMQSIDKSQLDRFRKIKLLTTKGTLKPAEDCYLSDFYKPELELEKVCDNDFFVSEKYCTTPELLLKWKVFLLEIGVNQKIDYFSKNVHIQETHANSLLFEYVKENIKKLASEHTGEWGWYERTVISFNSISFIEYADDNYSFAKLFWGTILCSSSITLENLLIKTVFMKYHIYRQESYFSWLSEKRNILPTTQKTCLKISEVYSHTYKEIAGKYLPVFDYEGAIPSDWQQYLKFKDLTITDYLAILHAISHDNKSTKEEKAENKKRIVAIYEKLVTFKSKEDQNKINSWAVGKKFLANDGNFYLHSDLTYIMEEGFTATNLIYTGDTQLNKDELKNLFRLFEVKIIDNIIHKPANPQLENNFKRRLQAIIPFLALIATSNHKANLANEISRLETAIDKTNFYQCEALTITYEGNQSNEQERSAFYEKESNNFYYKGLWHSPRVVTALVPDICKYLEIKNLEPLFLVLFLENTEEINGFLKEKGYNIDLLRGIKTDIFLMPNTPTPDIRTPSQQEYDEETGRIGEQFVYEQLQKMFAKTSIKWLRQLGEKYADHDFEVIHNGKTILIEVKATTWGEEHGTNFYISKNEWQLLASSQNDYFIARVFNTRGVAYVKWLLIEHQKTIV
jgi:hypothetical protein